MPTPPQRPYCTPPGAPRIPNVPICRPAFRGFVTPFGGPASGISPSGGGAGPAPAPIAPTPVPACVTASLFRDCFGSCTGVINAASPGPVCGWTYIEPFGPLGGQFNFTPGVMMMDSFDADDYPIAMKPFTPSLMSVFGISGQFEFTEYPTPPNGTTTYQIVVNNFDLTESLLVSLFGDGSFIVQAGDPVSIPTYFGAWTPNGGTHVVHFSIDGAGVPTAYLDGVAVPLTFVANFPSNFSLYPVNSMNYGGGSGDVTPASSPLYSLFLTAGATAPETEFCCT